MGVGTQADVSKVGARVWFHRVCAIVWVFLLIPGYLWWRNAIFFVIAASIYANVKSDWAASEAADDTDVLTAIANLDKRIDNLSAKSDIKGQDGLA